MLTMLSSDTRVPGGDTPVTVNSFHELQIGAHFLLMSDKLSVF